MRQSVFIVKAQHLRTPRVVSEQSSDFVASVVVTSIGLNASECD